MGPAAAELGGGPGGTGGRGGADGAGGALYRRTGEERFATAAERWWGEIDRYFLDADGGSWWPELAPDMTPAASTWSGKPDLYHAYQAVLLPSLPSLPLSPTAATALARRRSAAARPDQGVPSQSVLRL